MLNNGQECASTKTSSLGTSALPVLVCLCLTGRELSLPFTVTSCVCFLTYGNPVQF